jgi:hypothetical protein
VTRYWERHLGNLHQSEREELEIGAAAWECQDQTKPQCREKWWPDRCRHCVDEDYRTYYAEPPRAELVAGECEVCGREAPAVEVCHHCGGDGEQVGLVRLLWRGADPKPPIPEELPEASAVRMGFGYLELSESGWPTAFSIDNFFERHAIESSWEKNAWRFLFRVQAAALSAERALRYPKSEPDRKQKKGQ